MVVMFMCGVLMNVVGLVYSVYVMIVLFEEDWFMYLVVNIMVWDLGWVFSFMFLGVVCGVLDFSFVFNVLFGWMLLMYVVSVFVIYLGFYCCVGVGVWVGGVY